MCILSRAPAAVAALQVAAGSEVTTPGEPVVAALPAAPSLPQEAGAAPSSSIVPPTTLEPHLDEGQELFRLFVGNVPKAYQESDLRPLFDQVYDWERCRSELVRWAALQNPTIYTQIWLLHAFALPIQSKVEL